MLKIKGTRKITGKIITREEKVLSSIRKQLIGPIEKCDIRTELEETVKRLQIWKKRGMSKTEESCTKGTEDC